MTATRPLLRRRSCLIDTGAYHALIDRRDAHHHDAQTVFTRLVERRVRIVTTNAVLYETHGLLNNRVGSDQATQFLEELYQSETDIVRVSEADEESARAILKQYSDKDFSYTDALSFAVMERFRIPLAFAFDRHFTQYGLTVVTEQTVF